MELDLDDIRRRMSDNTEGMQIGWQMYLENEAERDIEALIAEVERLRGLYELPAPGMLPW